MSEQVIANVFNIFARKIEQAAKPEPEPDHMEAEYAALKADIPQTPGEAA